MSKNRKRFICVIVIAIMLVSTIVADRVAAGGPEQWDPTIVVSMGDSYSSGEGIPPFGLSESVDEKMNDLDWLAHRSENAWQGLLRIPGSDGHPLRDYRVGLGEGFLGYDGDWYKREESATLRWYFVAASGATTEHIWGQQNTEVMRGGVSFKKELPCQISVLPLIKSYGWDVDYVTLTIGGNNLGFSSIIKKAVLEPTAIKDFMEAPIRGLEMVMGTRVLNPNGVYKSIEKAKEAYHNSIKMKIKSVYKGIVANCANETMIIVAGYPGLLDVNGRGLPFSKIEAYWINNAAVWLDEELAELVHECQEEGLNIKYASVIEAFKGHEAYSEDPYIIEVLFGARGEDLREYIWDQPASNYSMHPNPAGALAYAARVQDIIDGGSDDARPREGLGVR